MLYRNELNDRFEGRYCDPEELCGARTTSVQTHGPSITINKRSNGKLSASLCLSLLNMYLDRLLLYSFRNAKLIAFLVRMISYFLRRLFCALGPRTDPD